MKIALAQIAATDERRTGLERVERAMAEAASAGAQLVAFPELALERFFPQHRRSTDAPTGDPIPGPLTDRIGELARRHGLVTVFNLYERDDRGRTFDTSPVFDADGTLLGSTRMAHITQYACFWEQDYYDPGDTPPVVYDTAAGRVGVAICYDRHYPEYMRALGVAGAEIVVIPQAGAIGEWPEGMFEAEVRAAAFQNGYFAALCNRVGAEDVLTFAGESFVSDPEGRILARGAAGDEDLVVAEVDLDLAAESTARRLFWRDRRPDRYRTWLGLPPEPPSEST